MMATRPRARMTASCALACVMAATVADEPAPKRHRTAFSINASQVAALMCLGDSWMTGFNVHRPRKGELDFYTDYRGGSWGCGSGVVARGDRVETLGTLIRRFNPALQGLSQGSHVFKTVDPCGDRRQRCGLNAAIDGASLTYNFWEGEARNSSLLTQARDLRRWIDDELPHLHRQWKVLTVMPSWGDQWWTPRDIGRIRAALWELFGYLGQALPRTYVNLVGVSEHPSTLDAMLAAHPGCHARVALWKALNFVTSAATFNRGPGADEYAAQINRELREVEAAFDGAGGADGLVVRLQPFMLGMRFERRLMDSMTCFHPSLALVDAMAFGLLQNMAAPGREAQLRSLPVFSAPPEPALARQDEAFRRAVAEATDLVLR